MDLNSYTALGQAEIYLRRAESKLRGMKETEYLCGSISSVLLAVQARQAEVREQILTRDEMEEE